MKSAILTGSVLIAALLSSTASGSTYYCEAADASSATGYGHYRLLRDVSGGSMGNPAQRSAFELRHARTGERFMRCPQGFRNGRLTCSGRTLGGADDRFTLERGSGRYALLRAGVPQESGLCRPGRG